jgi:hypothetical protein
MIRMTLLAACAAALAACASSPVAAGPGYALRAKAANGQDLSGVNIGARTLLESKQPAGSVTLQMSDQLREYGASFVVAVQNDGAEAGTFGPENVTATAGGRTLAVYTREQLAERVTGTARSMIRALDRDDPAQRRDVTEGTQAVARERSWNTYGGCPAGQSGCQIYSADNGASYRQGELDREANLETAASVAARLQAEMRPAQLALHTESVAPHAIAGGVLVIEHPKPGETLELTITFAGQPHRFSFMAAPVHRG